MEMRPLDDILTHVRAALERDDVTGAVAIIEGLRPADQADLFADLRDAHQITLLPELQPSDSADILERLENSEVADLAGQIATDDLIRIVEEMAPDEAADLLGDILPARAEAILAGLDDPDEIRPLLLYPDDSAGGLMTSEFLALRPRMTAEDAFAAIRTWRPDSETIYYLYVVSEQRRLIGVVSLRELVVADPATLLADFMRPDVVAVTVGTDQEECARIMLREDLLALPVVDADRTLVGVVTIDDVADVLVEEATEDLQRFGGAQPLGRSYLDSPVLTITRKRVVWLLLLFVTESLTGTVLRHFADELESVVALAFFVPLLIGTGGNAGTQTTSTIIRALAVGDITLRDGLRALWHEIRVGLLLGLAMAAIAYWRALTWGSADDLALTVALAIFIIVVWANLLGSVLPLLAVRLRIDPTVVSGPVMSTLVDATGLFIYFTIARLLILS